MRNAYTDGKPIFDRRHGPATEAAGDGQEGIYTGVLHTDIVAGSCKVAIPALDLIRYRTANVAPYVAGSKGDQCVVAFDEQKIPWVISAQSLIDFWLPTSPTGVTPSGADVVNNNILSAPSQMAIGSQTVALTGVNNLTGAASYDPNGWISGTQYVLPVGVYKIEWSAFVNYVGAPAVNITPALIIGGTPAGLQIQMTVGEANVFQPFHVTQLVTASSPGTTVRPAISNSATPNAGATFENGVINMTRVN